MCTQQGKLVVGHRSRSLPTHNRPPYDGCVRMPFTKDPRERRVEAATWGLVLVWAGIMLVWSEPAGIAGIGYGVLLLGSAILQKLMGWEAGLVLWAGGIALLLSGINDRLGRDQHVPAIAVILIIIGGMLVLRAFAKPRTNRHIRLVRTSNTGQDRPL